MAHISRLAEYLVFFYETTTEVMRFKEIHEMSIRFFLFGVSEVSEYFIYPRFSFLVTETLQAQKRPCFV